MRTWISILATAIAAAGLGGFCASPAIAQVVAADKTASEKIVPCKASLDLVKMARPLARLSHRIAAHEPVTIVAIGSSSTAGAGASSAAASYPSRLEVELSAQFPKSQIKVINRGVNGEEAADMLARFKDGVIAEKPDLVLWQIGTNWVLRDRKMSEYDALVRAGLAQIKEAGVDVVLIDPQFAPKVIAKPDAEKMVDLISATARRENVDLFKRFALMRSWHNDEKIPFETFMSSDGLHLNDWSYACFAKSLSVAIVEAATRPLTTVAASPAVR